MKRIAVVTGASSGMGKEYVIQIQKLYKNLDEIWVIARRQKRLEELAKKSSVKLVPLIMDLNNSNDYEILSLKLSEENPQIAMLVNSAGFGVHGYFKEQKPEDAFGMIDVNCLALTKITYICIPYMRKNSRIINMASAAAFFPQKKFSVYAASKAYVFSFSRSLNIELKKQQIYVTAVCPGPVNTEFFKKDNCDINKTFYKRMVMANAKDVVACALKDSVNKKEMSVYGLSMKAFYFLTKLVPHRLMLFFSNYIL